MLIPSTTTKENTMEKFDISKSKISFASSDRIDLYREEEDCVLRFLNHPEAMVTDLSTVGDFVMNYDDEEDSKELAELSKKLGFEVQLNTTLVDICEKLRNK